MRSWLPQRRGPIYCAPACGGGCTYVAFAKATKTAAKLAARLGRGWEAEVFENLGWHFNVNNKSMDLNVSLCNTSYMAILAEQYAGFGKMPERAIAGAIHKAKPTLAEMCRIDAAIKSYQARTR